METRPLLGSRPLGDLILAGGRAVCIGKVDSPRRLDTTSKVGRSVPLNSASVGKALLAFQPAEIRERLLASMEVPDLAERTITAGSSIGGAAGRFRDPGTGSFLVAEARKASALNFGCVEQPADFRGNCLRTRWW